MPEKPARFTRIVKEWIQSIGLAPSDVNDSILDQTVSFISYTEFKIGKDNSPNRYHGSDLGHMTRRSTNYP
jgi:hypothetical protein